MGARQTNVQFKMPRAPGLGVSAGLTVMGDKQLIRNFKLLTVKMQKKITRTAVTKIARRLAKAVKQQMTHEKDITHRGKTFETGLLRASIGHRVWTKKKVPWITGATIGPRMGFGKFVVRGGKTKRGLVRSAKGSGGIAKFFARGGEGNVTWSDPARYGHLVEGGSKRQKHGTVEKRPFMLHTILHADVMSGTLRTEIKNQLEREARKLPKTIR